MAIIVNIDVMLAKRKMSVTELADRVGITIANVSVLKNGKARAIRFSTLEAVCNVLDCQPGDILEYRKDMAGSSGADGSPEVATAHAANDSR
jgi:putative transcriptional regulator